MGKGRTRQANAPRTPSGQISRALNGQAGLYHPAAVKRLAEAATQRMADHQWGTVLGRLYLEEKLTSLEFEAGKRWDALSDRYYRAEGIPRPYPKPVSLERSPKSVDADPSTDSGQRAIAHDKMTIEVFHKAHEVLCQRGTLVEAAVRHTCEGEFPPVAYDGLKRLKDGLESLGRYWHLAKT